MSESTVCDDVLKGGLNWFEELCETVDYHCSLCEAVLTDVATLEETVKSAYATTARSMKELHDVGEIAKRWFGMWAFAQQVLSQAEFIQEANQICGVDLTILEGYRREAFDRLQLHCPQFKHSVAE